MAITVLNNVSSLQSQNALVSTQANLQKTLTQLSTGMRINSGADDAAGLSIANGMQANIAALTQSQQNASNAIGMLQTADGALSQVTTLLNRAVTLATEGATSGITSSQSAALQTEYTSIAAEINQIGTNTNFNGQNVFSLAGQTAASGATATNAAATVGAKTLVVSTNNGANVFTFTGTATSTVQNVLDAVNANVAGVTASLDSAGKLNISSGDSTMAVSGTSTGVGNAFGALTTNTGVTTVNTNNAFISDGTSSANTVISTAMGKVDATTLGVTGDLTTTAGAAAALTALVGANGAINAVAAQRGTIGASINRLNAASTVMSNQVQNLTSASNGIVNADIGKTVANMTQYNVLQSTGMAALQQANQAQQAVLKLVQ